MNLLRRAILAATLIAGIFPAIAQVPPPVPALPDTERRTTYVISSSTCACNVNFQLYGDSTDYQNWVEVWVNGVNIPAAGNWTITSPTGSLATIPRPITNAVLTFTVAQTGTVQIVGARRPRRVSQFSESRGVAARDLNQALTDIISQNREIWDKTNDVTGRGLFSQPGVTLGQLPTPASCAGMFLGFDGTGLIPTCSQIIGAGTLVTPGSTTVGDLAFWNSTNGKVLGDISPRALPTFTPDSGGSPGLAGIVPAPPVGSAAARKVLGATGTWISPVLTPSDFGAVCDGVTNDAVALQAWLDSVRDAGTATFTPAQSASGCATAAPLLLQASTNTGPVQGPRFIGTIHLKGILGLGASATGTSSGTNLTLSGVTGAVHVGDTVIGGGAPNNTHILSQFSGTPNGNGVYVTDFAAGVAGASLAITSDVLRIWNPTAVSTSQNFYYPIFDTLLLAAANPAVANCLSLRGYWGTISKVISREGCRNGDLVQFPNYIGPGSIPDEYESTPALGDLTCIGCGGYVINNLIGIGASPRVGGVRGTTSGGITTGQGAIFASGDENMRGGIAYTGLGWAVTVNQPPAGGGAIVTTPHEVFIGPGAGDIDCAQNGIKIAALEFGTVSGHRINIEPAAGICGGAIPQWPLVAWSFGGGGGRVNAVKASPYISIRAGVNLASSTLFDFNNDVNITNLTVDSTISDQTGTLAGAAFGTLYKNINPNATIRIIQNGITLYDNITNTTFAGLPPCTAGNNGSPTRIVTDSTTAAYRAAIAGGGANVVKAACINAIWVVN